MISIMSECLGIYFPKTCTIIPTTQDLSTQLLGTWTLRERKVAILIQKALSHLYIGLTPHWGLGFRMVIVTKRGIMITMLGSSHFPSIPLLQGGGPPNLHNSSLSPEHLGCSVYRV